MDPEQWEKITTATIQRHLHLAHLQSLYLALEDKMRGNRLERVAKKFCEPLETSTIGELKRGGRNMKLAILVPELHDFLAHRLAENSNWGAGENLKMYLEMASASIDLEEDWYVENFPDDLELCHSMETYRVLSSLL